MSGMGKMRRWFTGNLTEPTFDQYFSIDKILRRWHKPPRVYDDPTAPAKAAAKRKRKGEKRLYDVMICGGWLASVPKEERKVRK